MDVINAFSLAHRWHSRGYLPHFDGGEIPQFVTLRLADSIPNHVIDRWRRDLEKSEDQVRKVVIRRRIEAYLDQGYGQCYLSDERVAKTVQDALFFHDGTQYRLSSWVVMPNHVHFLATPFAGFDWSTILHSLKSYTAHTANTLLGRGGRFWQVEAFDRFIRDARHYRAVVAYIENNPVKARLCEKPEDWRYSSAWFRARIVETT